MRILGIELETKSDVVAAIALLISLFGILMQFKDYLIGSNINFLPPNQLIFRENKSAQGIDLVDVVARAVYINSGAQGYEEEVIEEIASVTIGKSKFRLVALNIVSPQRVADNLSYSKIQDFLPFLVKGESIESHYSQFVSMGQDIGQPLLTKDNFLLLSSTEKNIRFEMQYIHLSGFSETVACEASTDGIVLNITRKGWASVNCLASVTSGRAKGAHRCGEMFSGCF